jgi:hypothetical protein
LILLLLVLGILLQLKQEDKEAAGKNFKLHLLAVVDQKEINNYNNNPLTVNLHLIRLFLSYTRAASLTVMYIALDSNNNDDDYLLWYEQISSNQSSTTFRYFDDSIASIPSLPDGINTFELRDTSNKFNINNLNVLEE